LRDFDRALGDYVKAVHLNTNNAIFHPNRLPLYLAFANLPFDEMASVTFVSDMPWNTHASSGDGHVGHALRNKNLAGTRIDIAGTTYPKGVWIHAFRDEQPADVVLDVTGKDFLEFKADVGGAQHRWGKAGSVQFQVIVDGKVKAESPVLRSGDLLSFRVNVADAKKIVLRVLNGGDGYVHDNAAWGFARFVKAGADDPLEASLDLRTDANSDSWLFLAMLHWKLEDKEQARKWYDKAINWIEENKPDDELGRLRLKTAELLGIDSDEEHPEENTTDKDNDK
jgi:tetratricopeptide (TPR) repeat protein